MPTTRGAYQARGSPPPCETSSRATSRGRVGAVEGGRGGEGIIERPASLTLPLPSPPALAGFDYKGEPTPMNWPCINSHFGIVGA